MDHPLQFGKLRCVCVVVGDIEAATRRYAEIFGLDQWDVRDGEAFRTATGTTRRVSEDPIEIGPMRFDSVPVTFELIQPSSGASPFQAFRDERGPGICALTLAKVPQQRFGHLRDRLAGLGVDVASTIEVSQALRRHLFDTRALLGGYLVAVDVYDGDAPVEPEVSEHWDLRGAYTRPDGLGPVQLQKVHHFGVVVDNVMDAVREYYRLFGIGNWMQTEFRADRGSLENPFYRGEQVDHGYVSALAPFSDFGLEIITPTFGPSHYNKEFYDLHGQGVHHMLATITTDEADWDARQEWLTGIGVPTAMGADFQHGASSFCYLDTYSDLGGYLLEGLLIRDTSVRIEPERLIDFARLNDSL